MESFSVSGYVKLMENLVGLLSGEIIVEINLNNLVFQVGGFYVYVYLVFFGSSLLCFFGSVGGYFNLFDVDVNISFVNGMGFDDQYEVGDLSGCYGNFLNGQISVGVMEMDFNFLFWGLLSVVGRFIVIYKVDFLWWFCGNIVEDIIIIKGVMYKVKVIFFNGIIQGIIIFVSVLSFYYKMYLSGI